MGLDRTRAEKIADCREVHTAGIRRAHQTRSRQRAPKSNGVRFPVSDGVDIRLVEKSANLAMSDLGPRPAKGTADDSFTGARLLAVTAS
jgi:hypothetical protein